MVGKVEVDETKFGWFDVLKSIWYFAEEDRGKFAFWSIFIFILYFFRLIPPIFVGLIVNFFTDYTKGDSLELFYIYCTVIAGLYVFVSIFRLHSKKVLGDIAINSRYRVKVKGFEKLMSFNLKWHDKENSGNKVQKINTGALAIKDWIKMLYNDLLIILTTFIGVLIIFIFLDKTFLIFFFIYLSLFFGIEYYFNNKISILVDKVNKASEIANGKYYESTNNIMSIKTLGVQNNMGSSIIKFESIAKKYSLERRTYMVRKWQFFQALNGISLGVFLYLIGVGVITGGISIGFIFVFFNYFEKLRDSAQDVTKIITTMVENKSALRRMMPIFLDNNQNYFGKEKFPRTWKNIKFSNVDFSYNTKNKTNKKNEITNLNFNIKKNEKIGIVGHSGSGKSTIVKLFLGLYKINSGEIKIGNKNFYNVAHNEISKNISVVLQETELFNMSLKDNITMLKDVDENVFKHSIEIAKLDSVIAKLKNGVNSLIGEKGYRLSGGERQRVGIARAICKNSSILVLDEATSSLDSITEMKIQRALEDKLSKKTMIIVAHRLSTLKHVDKILVFEKGKIIEEGTFSSLSKRKGSKFKELLDLQNKK